MSFVRSLFTAASAAVLAVSAHAEMTVTTPAGELSLDSVPEVIVAMDNGALDTIYALGGSVAAMTMPNYLAHLEGQLDDVESVGSAFEPSFEAIANIAPDLTIVGARGARFMGELANIGPAAVMSVGYGNNDFADTLTLTAAYGEILGKQAEAANLIADMEAKLAEARAVTEGAGNALIIIVSGDEIAAYGLDSRFGWLHHEFGIGEAVADLEPGRHGQAISNEFIAEINPEYLLVIDRSTAIGRGEPATTALNNPLVNGTTAGQSGNIIYLPAAEIYIGTGGHTSMMIVLDSIIEAFGG